MGMAWSTAMGEAHEPTFVPHAVRPPVHLSHRQEHKRAQRQLSEQEQQLKEFEERHALDQVCARD